MDTEYILDSALELGEINALEYAVATSDLGTYQSTRELVDNDMFMPSGFLSNTARAHLQSVTPEHRYMHALCALPVVGDSLQALAGRATVLVQRKVQTELGVIRPRMTGLCAADEGRVAAVRVPYAADVSEGLVRQLLDTAYSHKVRQWEQDLRLMAQAVHWYQAGGQQHFEHMLLSPVSRHSGAVSAARLLERAQAASAAQFARHHRKERALQSKAKAAVKKATRLFDGLGKSEELRMFVSSSEVTLQGPDSPLKFVLKPLKASGWLLDRTIAGRAHTPYELQLLTKDDIHLANLCVYFQDTPVLDQMLSLMLFIETGNELEVLMKANWFGVEDWTVEKTKLVLDAHPQLHHKLPNTTDRAAGLQILPPAEEQQWEPYRGRVQRWVQTWLEPTSALAGTTLAGAKETIADVARLRAALRQLSAPISEPRLLTAT